MSPGASGRVVGRGVAEPGIRVEVATVEVTDQAEDGAATVPVLVARIAA